MIQYCTIHSQTPYFMLLADLLAKHWRADEFSPSNDREFCFSFNGGTFKFRLLSSAVFKKQIINNYLPAWIRKLQIKCSFSCNVELGNWSWNLETIVFIPPHPANTIIPLSPRTPPPGKTFWIRTCISFNTSFRLRKKLIIIYSISLMHRFDQTFNIFLITEKYASMPLLHKLYD